MTLRIGFAPGRFFLGSHSGDWYISWVTLGTNLKGEDDAALVRSALLGPELFGAIVTKYEAPLSRYLLRLGCSLNEDREDVLQEVFLKIYVNLNEYDERLTFSSWMYRIAHNEIVSHFRKKSARPEIEIPEDLSLLESIADDTDHIADYDRKLLARALRDALNRMEERYRTVLVLHYFEHKQYDEISDILQIPIGTVGTLVRRGKQTLQSMLSADKLL